MTGEDSLYLIGCEMDTTDPDKSPKGSVTSSTLVGDRERIAFLQRLLQGAHGRGIAFRCWTPRCRLPHIRSLWEKLT